MTWNDEFRMSNDEVMTKHEIRSALSRLPDNFVILISGFIRHSSFVIRHFQ